MFMSVTKTRRDSVDVLPKNSFAICSFSVLFGCHFLYMMHTKKRTIFILPNSYPSVTLIIYKHTSGVENKLAVAGIA